MAIGRCGTHPYIAPEEYSENEFDPRAADVWATGMIFMAMCAGCLLWDVAKRMKTSRNTWNVVGMRLVTGRSRLIVGSMSPRGRRSTRAYSDDAAASNS